MYQEIIDFLMFCDNTSQIWPFSVPYSRITLDDLSRIKKRLEGFGCDDTETIYGCCEAVLGKIGIYNDI